MTQDQQPIVVLTGNPNTGKTSLFNELTDQYEYIGNWSGVTVEKKTGMFRRNPGTLVDLPGVYSLNPISRDESVVSRFLLEEPYSTILNIVDGSQLARNLYLTVQLLELDKPLLLAINMIDVAEKQGIQIDYRKLEEKLGVPLVPIVAREGKGTEELEQTLFQFTHESAPDASFSLRYPKLEACIEEIVRMLPDLRVSKRWAAIQYLEGNTEVAQFLHRVADPQHLETGKRKAQEAVSGSVETYIRNIRDAYIDDLLAEVVIRRSPGPSVTGSLDRFLLHPVWNIPVFLGVMYLIFKFTFDWIGGPLSDLLDSRVFVPLAGWMEALLTLIGAAPFIRDLILEGIIPGVGGVLVFVPQIFTLFFFITLLEDSGYMTRIAVIVDRLLEKVGLNGKSIIPMIIGFGCNVPAVMAARTIENPKERMITILITPLMSCSARLPVYTLFAGAFFAEHQATVVFSLYILGILAALVLARLFSATLFRQDDSVFVADIPPYRVPHFKTLWRSTWEKGKGFVYKAGTFIFAGAVVIWLLTYAGPGGIDVDIQDSFLAWIGQSFAFLFIPLGFGTWESAASLMTGFLAKEVVVSTMNIIYATPDLGSLKGLIATRFTPLQAYSFMVFVLFYVPCVATAAVMKHETGSNKWMWFAIAYSFLLAYLLSLLVYQGGRFLFNL
ncbi:MAG: ferrous iron transport protein B [Bacillaceae bacterium]|nr:ferrous iron transport protein B [Bacillaceae bacterium]